MNIVRPQEAEGLKCIFYKNEICHPQRINFKICLKCHRCQAVTFENAFPAIFNRIVGMAIFFMKAMGMGTGAAGGSGGGGAAGAGGGK